MHRLSCLRGTRTLREVQGREPGRIPVLTVMDELCRGPMQVQQCSIEHCRTSCVIPGFRNLPYETAGL